MWGNSAVWVGIHPERLARTLLLVVKVYMNQSLTAPEEGHIHLHSRSGVFDSHSYSNVVWQMLRTQSCGVARSGPTKQESRKDKTHRHKQISGMVPGLGGDKDLFMCFGGSVPRKPDPQKIPRKSQENIFIYVFCSSLLLFRSQKESKGFCSTKNPDKGAFCPHVVMLWGH